MGKNIAVQGCTLQVTSTLGAVVPSYVITSSPSSDCSINSKGIYFDKITANLMGTTIVPATPVAGTTNKGTLTEPNETTADINGTGNNCVELNGAVSKPCVLQDDTVTKTFTFMFETTTTPPGTTPVEFPLTIKVLSAGQTDVSLD